MNKPLILVPKNDGQVDRAGRTIYAITINGNASEAVGEIRLKAGDDNLHTFLEWFECEDSMV